MAIDVASPEAAAPPGHRGAEHVPYFASPGHEEARARLEFVVDRRRPCGLLTGPAGTGKTFLFQLLAKHLRRDGRDTIAVVDLRGLDADEIPWHVAAALGLGPDDAAPTWRKWNEVRDHLRGARLCGDRVVLLLDHLDRAQAGGEAAIESLLRLAYQADGGLTLLFAARTATDALAARTAELSDLRIELRPLDAAQTGRYLAHRLRVDHGSYAVLDSQVADAVFQHARGVPRAIDRICDLLIASGWGRPEKPITATAVAAVCGELPAAGARC